MEKNLQMLHTCIHIHRHTHTSKKYFVVHLNRKIVKEKCLQWQREYNCNTDDDDDDNFLIRIQFLSGVVELLHKINECECSMVILTVCACLHTKEFSFCIPSIQLLEMLKCIPSCVSSMCAVHIRGSVCIKWGCNMDRMNDTRSCWNFLFVSFLFAAHLFIHSFVVCSVYSVQFTQSMLNAIPNRSVFSLFLAFFTSARESLMLVIS